MADESYPSACVATFLDPVASMLSVIAVVGAGDELDEPRWRDQVIDARSLCKSVRWVGAFAWADDVADE